LIGQVMFENDASNHQKGGEQSDNDCPFALSQSHGVKKLR